MELSSCVKDYSMIDYMKKRACKINISLLRYAGAFSDGFNDGRHQREYYSKDACPKLLRAYRDGIRMKKKELTQSKVADSIREH